MRNLLSFFLAGFFLVTVLFTVMALNSSAAAPSNNMIGTVTLVGDNMMKILDENTGLEFDYRINDSQEEHLTTGYQVELETNDGRVTSYTVLGIPENVEQIVYSTRGLEQFRGREEPLSRDY